MWTIANDFMAYVNDLRPTAISEEECWWITRVIASLTQYFGVQGAPRKRRPPSREPGAWAGAVVLTGKGAVWVTASQEKWDKIKAIISHWSEEVVVENTLFVDSKALERDRGFLVYVSRTYTSTVPYLKGFHHTLETWMGHRDNDGWKKDKNKERKGYQSVEEVFDYLNIEGHEIGHLGSDDRPERV